MYNITSIAEIGAIGVVMRRVTAMATGITDHTIVRIGDRHRSIAIRRVIGQPRCIVVAMRMCAGVTIATAPTARTTTHSSPIMDHGASAIRHISKQKSPGQSGAFS